MGNTWTSLWRLPGLDRCLVGPLCVRNCCHLLLRERHRGSISLSSRVVGAIFDFTTIISGVGSHMLFTIVDEWLCLLRLVRNRLRDVLTGDHLCIDKVILQNLTNFPLLVLNNFSHVDEGSEVTSNLIWLCSLVRAVLGKLLLCWLYNIRCFWLVWDPLVVDWKIFYVCRRWLLDSDTARTDDFALLGYLLNTSQIARLEALWPQVSSRIDLLVDVELLCNEHGLLHCHSIILTTIFLLSLCHLKFADHLTAHLTWLLLPHASVRLSRLISKIFT